METRKHEYQIELPREAEEVFAILHTPSAIRQWWSADRVIVIAREGGIWAAAWGENEDNPDYVSSARIARFEPPTRIALTDFIYYSKYGPLPFKADLVTEFIVERIGTGSILKVVQDGFPVDKVADDFYAGCEKGWRDTFEGIKRYLMDSNN